MFNQSHIPNVGPRPSGGKFGGQSQMVNPGTSKQGAQERIPVQGPIQQANPMGGAVAPNSSKGGHAKMSGPRRF